MSSVQFRTSDCDLYVSTWKFRTIRNPKFTGTYIKPIMTMEKGLKKVGNARKKVNAATISVHGTYYRVDKRVQTTKFATISTEDSLIMCALSTQPGSRWGSLQASIALVY